MHYLTSVTVYLFIGTASVHNTSCLCCAYPSIEKMLKLSSVRSVHDDSNILSGENQPNTVVPVPLKMT